MSNVKSKVWPTAMTVAGSDSGGGAGIQADLKMFHALHVHGTCAITCVTAQNLSGVTGMEPMSPAMVGLQMASVAAGYPVAAVKTGMLFNREIIEAVATQLKSFKKIPVVVDPVAAATSGATLLKPDALKALKELMLPLATLVTPNLDEVSAITGLDVTSPEAMRKAARAIYGTYGCAVLVKGGHLTRTMPALDVFYDGKTELLLTAPRLKGKATHGTGCTYCAAITAYLARGKSLSDSVKLAKQRITESIAMSVRTGKSWILNPVSKP